MNFWQICHRCYKDDAAGKFRNGCPRSLEKIAESGDRALNREMRLTVDEMNNGVAELDAYKNFADRCAIKEIRSVLIHDDPEHAER